MWHQVMCCAFLTKSDHGVTQEVEGEAKIVAVDLQEMAPIPGVKMLQGDITAQATADSIIRYCRRRGDVSNDDDDDDDEEEEEEKEDGDAAAAADDDDDLDSAPHVGDLSPPVSLAVTSTAGRLTSSCVTAPRT
jgi:hypothetical protein